jgi:hypothetical protein
MAGSTPYFLFGAQRRYPYAWHGGAGGVPQSRVAAESRGMGIFDMAESGFGQRGHRYGAFKHTQLHDPSDGLGLGDFPLVRPAGPEPLDPHQGSLSGIPIWDGLSDNEKKLVGLAVAGGLAYWLWRQQRGGARRRRGRHNPSPKSWVTLSTRSPKGKRGSLRVGRASADSIARWYRRHGYSVSVKNA